MAVGAGVGVSDRLKVHHVLPEIGRLDARQELLRGVVHARIARVRCLGVRAGRPERADGYEPEQDKPRPRQSRAWTMRQGTLPLGADHSKWSRCASVSSAGTRTSGRPCTIEADTKPPGEAPPHLRHASDERGRGVDVARPAALATAGAAAAIAA